MAPWITSWQQNYFGARFAVLGGWMGNEFVRGAISGVGLITAAAGVRDLASTIFDRRSPDR